MAFSQNFVELLLERKAMTIVDSFPKKTPTKKLAFHCHSRTSAHIQQVRSTFCKKKRVLPAAQNGSGSAELQITFPEDDHRLQVTNDYVVAKVCSERLGCVSRKDVIPSSPWLN